VSYVEENLLPGERVLYRAKLHWITFVTIGALLTWFVWPMLRLLTSEFAVTSQRVIIKVGLIARRTIELNLSKIESISVDQALFGRLLGYGNITVIGSGGTRETFKLVADPLAFRRAVQQATT
jgi:uncharacterized membrane protein YdbT with pleckstrin-like domain